MCRHYEKLPTKEDSCFPSDHKAESKKQSKWKKVKKAAEKVCDFLFGDFQQLSAAELTKYTYVSQPLMYTDIYAVGYIGYW